ncbi:MAG: UDP-N-acetylglucosamine 4-epimerase [Verrucomicrobiae bacterium]|nr:UDP-N-acetylglucosamine 4-epimerase [Verrucomicrobiae bacterium]
MIDYLITGGAGFIGSNITEHLLKAGKSVRVFDNFSSGKRANLIGQPEVVEGDLADPAAVKRAVAGVRYVIHMGAMPSVPRSVEEPAATHAANITGTLNVLIAARDAGVQRVVFSSSSSVYGESPTLPKREDMIPSPLSPYAVHKITGEYYCRCFYQLYGLETVSLRYFNVFGPRQNPASAYAAVIPRFITAILKGEPPTIFGDGQQTRDFSHVENVIAGNLAACTAGKAACGESFNVACGGRISLLDLVDVINQITGQKIKPKFEPPRAGDIKDSQADIAKAAKLLNWTPTVDFQAGIEKAVAWYRHQLT